MKDDSEIILRYHEREQIERVKKLAKRESKRETVGVRGRGARLKEYQIRRRKKDKESKSMRKKDWFGEMQ